MAKRYAPMDKALVFGEDLAINSSDIIPAGQEGGFYVGSARQEFQWVTDIAAIDVGTGNELYNLVLQGSNVADFASGVENLAVLNLGHTSTRLGSGKTSLVGRYQVPVTNELNGVTYKYVRLNVLISGTVASSGFGFTSYLSKPIDVV